MALRKLRLLNDEILRKTSKEVKAVNSSILELLDDMAETMYKANGVGLAGVQVGVLKRVVVIDVGEGLHELINPVILEQTGSQKESEGCLSIPGINRKVDRPSFVKVKYLNRDGDSVTLETDDLMAVAVSHEVDHLNGILFTDKAIIDDDDYDDLLEDEDYGLLEDIN